MLAVDLCVGFAVLTVVSGAAAVLSRPAWVTRTHLAPAYALLGLGLVAHLVWILFWIAPAAGQVGSFAIMAGSVAVVARAAVWGTWRHWAPLVALTAGVGALIVGYTFLWGGADNPFATESTRFNVLPPDNFLQHLFADRLWKGEGTTGMLADWNGSDRPPLQSGLLLLVRPLGRFLGVSASADEFDAANMQLGAAVSILAQLLWVPAVYCLIRTLRLRPVTSAVTVLFCASTPVVFGNTIYTWPKLLAAALAVVAVALLVDALVAGVRPRAHDLCAASVLTVLAFLAHGGIAFTAPLFAVLGVLLLRSTDRRTGLRWVGATGVAAVLTYLPWVLYGRFADPSTNRLLKWHLAGVVPPTDDGLIETIVRSYRNTPVHDLLAFRRANFSRVFNLGISDRWDLGPGWAFRVRDLDFFNLTIALGLGSVLTLALLGWVTAKLILRRPVSAPVRAAATLCVGSLASILFWVLLMFLPDGALVHQGSYAWILILLAVPFALLTERVPAAGWILVACSVLYAEIAYTAPRPQLVGAISHTAVLTMTCGAVLTGLAVWVLAAGRSAEAAPDVGGRHRENGRADDGDETDEDVSRRPPRL